jgi:hypothetical protein
MREWPIRLRPSITYYPERTLPPSMELTHLLPRDKPMLGISIISQRVMCQALEKNAALIRQHLEGFRDHAIVPIVSTVHLSASEENDIAGFKFFEDLFLRDFDVRCREFLDKSWWLENMTPLRLKGVISQLSTLLSQRKHNGIHAIGSGVRLVGIHPENDDSVPRVFFSLRSRMPLKSYCFALPIEG